MGELVSMHLIKQQPETDAIRSALPSSVGFRIYRHSSLNLFAIDTFRGDKPPLYPFTSSTPATDLSTELGSHLSSLASVYEGARRSGYANCIKRSYINLAEALSEALRQPVLSICSDDDDSDFACLSVSGRASVVIALCDDNVVRYANGTTEIVPASDEHMLHQYAIEAFEEFTGASAETIGLGSSDPPDDFGFVE
ncbi:MAG TPA: hypothetical protein VGW12_03805 [Pyrinomonadaceae bacterium]|nr:hypothetical protein [Pyrinomonadaceae bacterium]